MTTSSAYDQASYALRCEWGYSAPQSLARADVVVVVDVLSFSTTVEVAVARGATVLPHRWKEDAASFAAERGAVVAGQRGHARSLSPSSFLDAPAGLRCVLPSPNGAMVTLAAAETGAIVLAGCLRNARAVASVAADLGRSVAIVPAGERWPDGSLRPAYEDWIGAGAILDAFSESFGRRSPEAAAAVAAFRGCESLLEQLMACGSGRELAERGWGGDVVVAAQIDVSDAVPIFRDGEYRAYSRPSEAVR